MVLANTILLFAVTIVVAGESYNVSIYTGNDRFAGTDATVTIRLFGSNGTSKKIKLAQNRGNFERGSVDKFTIKSFDLGDIYKINIGQDGDSIFSPSWKLLKVEIRTGSTQSLSEFYANKWLDKKSGRYLSIAKKIKSSECGITTLPRVVNGISSREGQWPWQAQLSIPSIGNKHSCGGTLIHPQYVLTASHCVDEVVKQKMEIKVTMGEHDLTKQEGTEQRFSTSKVIIHPGWDKSKIINDIALIKLSRPVLLNNRVNLACLPKRNHFQKENGVCYVSGWGRIFGGGPVPDVIRHAYLPSLSQSECSKKMSEINQVTELMLCGGGNNKGGCHGDSGGPYVCLNSNNQFVVQGAVSWGNSYCTTTSYTVFARVSKYMDWIESNIYSEYSLNV